MTSKTDFSMKNISKAVQSLAVLQRLRDALKGKAYVGTGEG